MPATPRRARPSAPRPASSSRRRLLLLAFGVLLVVGLGSTVGYQKLKDSDLFAVHHVVVTGADESLEGTVSRKVDSLVGHRSLLALDAGSLAHGLEQLPEVRSAHVDRDFPSSLHVQIVPERAVAIAVSGHERVVVSSDGRVLQTIGRRSAPPNLPRVGLRGRGVPSPGTHIADAEVRDELTALAAVPPAFGARVAWARHDPDHGIEFQLGAGGVKLYLGDVTQLHDKLAAATLLLRYYTADKRREKVHYLDVESPSRPAAQEVSADPATTGTDPATNTTDPGAATTSTSTNG